MRVDLVKNQLFTTNNQTIRTKNKFAQQNLATIPYDRVTFGAVMEKEEYINLPKVYISEEDRQKALTANAEDLKKLHEKFKKHPELIKDLHTKPVKVNDGNAIRLPIHYANFEKMKEIVRVLRKDPSALYTIFTTKVEDAIPEGVYDEAFVIEDLYTERLSYPYTEDKPAIKYLNNLFKKLATETSELDDAKSISLLEINKPILNLTNQKILRALKNR